MIKKFLRSRIVLVCVFALGLCGCTTQAKTDEKVVESTENVNEESKSEATEVKQEYPKIAYIENINYYGTDEKCEAVPRKAPDGVIETFVNKEIMPDAYNSANFGLEQENLEYMFLEDGRLIIHIGEDWYYFEKQE